MLSLKINKLGGKKGLAKAVNMHKRKTRWSFLLSCSVSCKLGFVTSENIVSGLWQLGGTCTSVHFGVQLNSLGFLVTKSKAAFSSSDCARIRGVYHEGLCHLNLHCFVGAGKNVISEVPASCHRLVSLRLEAPLVGDQDTFHYIILNAYNPVEWGALLS